MKKTITIPILLLVFSFLFFNSYGQKSLDVKPKTTDKQKQAKDSFGPTYRKMHKTAKKSDSFGPTYRNSYANNNDNSNLQQFEIKPYAGFSQPLGTFRNFSKPGAVVGLSADYFITPNFALGMDINSQFNAFKNPFDFSKIPKTILDTTNSIYGFDHSVLDSTSGSWSRTTLCFGPTYRMNYKKISSELYAKVGVTFLSTPEANTTNFLYPKDTIFSQPSSRDFFRLRKQNSISFGLTTGIRFYYHINKMISVYVNPQLVYSSAKIEYSFQDMESAFYIDPATGEEVYNNGFWVDQEVQKADFNLGSNLNVNAGVSINIGTKPKPKQIKDSFGPTYRNNYKKTINNEENCQACKLNNSTNQKDYTLDQTDRPNFSWEEKNQSKPEKYILRLTDEKGEILYKSETKKTSVSHNQELESVYQIYASDKKKKMYWDVESQFEECGSQTSERNSFSLKSGSVGLDVDLQNLTCESPAFDEDGYVHYTAEVLFSNSANNDESVTIPAQGFKMNVSTLDGQETDANQITCSGSVMVQFPLTLAPGEDKTICVSFKRPFGEGATTFIATSHETGFAAQTTPAYANEDLPSCICNVCEDWKVMFSNEKVKHVSGNSSNIKINSDLQILNTENIQKINAEIVSVQHQASDELCYTCTKEETRMALFGKTTCSINNGANWENNGRGDLSDVNGDKYGNNLTWKTKLNEGVDFNQSHKFTLYLNLPENNKLDCCGSLYTICIRYTFTNINCETCSYLVCYEYDSKDIPSSTGPIVPGTLDSGDLQNIQKLPQTK